MLYAQIQGYINLKQHEAHIKLAQKEQLAG